MNNGKFLLAALLSVLILCTGCGGKPQEFPKEDPNITVRIVDGAESETLILADAHQFYTLDASALPIFYEKEPDRGKNFRLKDGMTVTIAYSGKISGTAPACLRKPSGIFVHNLDTNVDKNRDYCGLYLQALNDLWETESGINSGAEYVSIDLSDAPGALTQGEMQAVTWIFSGEHGLVGMTRSEQALIDEGYIIPYGPLYDGLRKWEKGIAFTIIEAPDSDGQAFHISKWRSDLCSFRFLNCVPTWNADGSLLEYTIESQEM